MPAAAVVPAGTAARAPLGLAAIAVFAVYGTHAVLGRIGGRIF
ncbi:hypothetical protein ABZV75_34490 [Streptomyces flaveolus]